MKFLKRTIVNNVNIGTSCNDPEIDAALERFGRHNFQISHDISAPIPHNFKVAIIKEKYEDMELAAMGKNDFVITSDNNQNQVDYKSIMQALRNIYANANTDLKISIGLTHQEDWGFYVHDFITVNTPSIKTNSTYTAEQYEQTQSRLDSRQQQSH